MENETRTTRPAVKVYCLDEERQHLKKMAAASGNSVSSYLLKVGMGYKLESNTDLAAIADMARVNGDLGRLGGLLKMWLTNDEKLAHFSKADMRENITAVLARIEDHQHELRELMRAVLKKN